MSIHGRQKDCQPTNHGRSNFRPSEDERRRPRRLESLGVFFVTKVKKPQITNSWDSTSHWSPAKSSDVEIQWCLLYVGPHFCWKKRYGFYLPVELRWDAPQFEFWPFWHQPRLPHWEVVVTVTPFYWHGAFFSFFGMMMKIMLKQKLTWTKLNSESHQPDI